jgi:hypothetical protein
MWRLAKLLQSDTDSAHKQFLDNSTNLFVEKTTFIVTSYLPAYEVGTDRLFRNDGIKIQTPGRFPEESIQYSENVASLKLGILLFH